MSFNYSLNLLIGIYILIILAKLDLLTFLRGKSVKTYEENVFNCPPASLRYENSI